MRFGLTTEQEKTLRQRLIDPLNKKNIQVFIFGSRVKGNYHKFSDIDILVDDVANPVDQREISGILEWFENSNFTLKIDLVLKSQLAKSYEQDVFSSMVQL